MFSSVFYVRRLSRKFDVNKIVTVVALGNVCYISRWQRLLTGVFPFPRAASSSLSVRTFLLGKGKGGPSASVHTIGRRHITHRPEEERSLRTVVNGTIV